MLLRLVWLRSLKPLASAIVMAFVLTPATAADTETIEIQSHQVEEIEDAPWRDSLQITTRLGTESWRVDYMGVDPNSTLKDTLRMPDGALRWPYRDISPWMTMQANYQVTPQLGVMGKFQANQAFGGRIDELAINYAVSPLLGLRAGVVDYKLSWCKDYELNNAWIQDPNQFCSDILNKRMTAAGPGFQAYLNFPVGKYQVQTLAGVYSPKIFSYDDMENGRNGNYLTYELPTQKNDKFGLALNVLDLSTGTEIRASWLYTGLQLSVDPMLYPKTLGPTDKQEDNTIYLAVEKPLTHKLSASLYLTRSLKVVDTSYRLFNPNNYFIETWTNLSGATAEVSYIPAPSHRLMFAFSKYEGIKRYTSFWRDGRATYPEKERSYLIHNAAALSWHKEWSHSISTTLQWKRVVYSLSLNAEEPAVWSSNALGIRLGYTF